MDNLHFQLPDWGSSASEIKKQYAISEAFMRTWSQAPEQTG